MPKDTFFNLDTTKRSKILLAAKEEFTKHVLHKSRVSNIIKNAGIPRGSFYQYFEDLEDLYFFVIDESLEEIHEYGLSTVKRTKDVFEFAELTFDYDYNGFNNDKRHQFMMNIIKSISDNAAYIEQFNQKRMKYVKLILSSLDLSKIRVQTEKEQIKMYYMIQEMKRNVIGKSMFDKLSKEEAKQEFKWYIDILKHGLLED